MDCHLNDVTIKSQVERRTNSMTTFLYMAKEIWETWRRYRTRMMTGGGTPNSGRYRVLGVLVGGS